jgi:hypothetical protein
MLDPCYCAGSDFNLDIAIKRPRICHIPEPGARRAMMQVCGNIETGQSRYGAGTTPSRIDV